jgi:hypothetical protein
MWCSPAAARACCEVQRIFRHHVGARIGMATTVYTMYLRMYLRGGDLPAEWIPGSLGSQ